jgi:LysR family transcriptional regulator, hydrogen peroxide-inducible genes activator
VERSDKPFGGVLRLAAISTLGPKLVDGELNAVLLSLPQTDTTLTTAEIFSEPFLVTCP